MANDAILAINASLGKTASEKETSLEAKVKASMRAVIDGNWMTTNDDELFRAGIGGACMDVGLDSDEGRQLVRSIDALKKFSAFMNAARAGLNVSPDGLPGPDDEPVLPLMGWWHEVKAETK